jgi:hypothetical protein
MKKMSGTSFIPRTLDDFTELVGQDGWTAAETMEANPVYQVTSLRKMQGT